MNGKYVYFILLCTVPCWFSYRHFPPSGVLPSWRLFPGVYLYGSNVELAWGSRLRFRVKPVFPPPPLPSFDSVSQRSLHLLLGPAQRNLAAEFNSQKVLATAVW